MFNEEPDRREGLIHSFVRADESKWSLQYDQQRVLSIEVLFCSYIDFTKKKEASYCAFFNIFRSDDHEEAILMVQSGTVCQLAMRLIAWKLWVVRFSSLQLMALLSTLCCSRFSHAARMHQDVAGTDTFDEIPPLHPREWHLLVNKKKGATPAD